MKAALLFLALCLAALCALAAGDCSVSITQTLGSTWKQDGKDRSQWNAVITAGSEAVKSVQISITGGNIVQVWELERQSNGLYALPPYRLQAGGLAAGQTHQFGYVWESAAKATISVASINCGSAASPSIVPASPAASPSPAPASPSASPAAPSPSAAPASPSASPSTVVSTPQPAGCSVTVTQTARAGSSWTDANFRYQTYDLVVSNNGNRAAAAAQFTLGLTAGQEVSQLWNIERQGTTANVFNVAPFYFPLAAGAKAEAGYILKSPLSAATAAPSLTVNQVRCAAAPSPSSAAPSPSAAPASPSAMPSANPTIVASPQPSSAPAGCSVKATIVARSASAGGVWQDNGNTFQIFDITITNNGQRPTNGGLISFALSGSSPAITQFWELSRQGSTNAFNISFNYGALQVGASQGAGIIVRVAGSAPAAAPGLTISQLACQ